MKLEGIIFMLIKFVALATTVYLALSCNSVSAAIVFAAILLDGKK